MGFEKDEPVVAKILKGGDADLLLRMPLGEFETQVDLKLATEIVVSFAAATVGSTIDRAKTASGVVALTSDIAQVKLRVTDTNQMLVKDRQSFVATVTDAAGKVWKVQFTKCLSVVAPQIG